MYYGIGLENTTPRLPKLVVILILHCEYSLIIQPINTLSCNT